MDISFESLTTQNGLSHNYVCYMMQDKKGLLWISTEDYVINVYDGYSFKVIKPRPDDPDSPISTGVISMVEDNAGQVWWLTRLIGNQIVPYVVKYDPATGKATNFELAGPLDLGYIYENQRMVKTKDEQIYVLLTEHLYRYSVADGDFKREPLPEPVEGVYTALLEDDGKLLITSTSSIIWYDPQQKIVVSTLPYHGAYPSRLYKDSKARYWLGTEDERLVLFDRVGIKKVYNFSGTRKRLFGSGIADICETFCETFDGLLWISTARQGLILFAPDTERYVNYVRTSKPGSLSSNYLGKMLMDRGGVLWIATQAGGVCKFSPYVSKFQLYRFAGKDKLEISNFVRGIWLTKRDELLVCLQDEGLYYYNRLTGTQKLFDEKTLLVKNAVDVIEDRKGRIWVATASETITLLKPSTGQSKHFRFLGRIAFWKLLEDDRGKLWIGSSNGLHEFDPDSQTFESYYPANTGLSGVQSLFIDRQGLLWLGTSGGLLAFDLAKRKYVKCFRNDPTDGRSLSNNFVTFVTESRDGKLLVATKGGGLNICLDRDKGIFATLRTKDGMPHDNLYACVEDEQGYYWLSSDNGICKYDLAKRKGEYFTKEDGLQDLEFNRFACHIAASGEIFLGGINGLNSFFPDKVRRNVVKPNIIFTRLLRNNEQVKITPEITYRQQLVLDYEERSFTVEFALLEYSLPQRSSYQYMLEGFDVKWTSTTAENRRATYTNLPPGKYIFRVRGCHFDGACNEDGARLSLTVLPPWWMTWWAYILFTVAGLAVSAGLVHGVIRLRTAYLTRIVNQKTAELVEQKACLEEINHRLLDGIKYAERIQSSILPYRDKLEETLGKCFILYRPKDIVSGDFYWFYSTEDVSLFAVVDSTGHGVPGALMSMLGDQLLNQIVAVRKTLDPGQILSQMHIGIVETLKQYDKSTSDGFDVALCKFDFKRQEIYFAGARRPLYYIDDTGSFREIAGTRRSIGGYFRRLQNQYVTHVLDMKKIRRVYLFSDGITDQQNSAGKKFGKDRLKNLLLETASLPLGEQYSKLLEDLLLHQGEEPQRDDITVVGIELNHSENVVLLSAESDISVADNFC
ncbi:MAG: two-component regulator propeller domain-containing protein [Acidobacteriota bacterium]|nr:SpoIIE family protein phosphatase [Blastocatellia bacterium]MDW8411536.1 two-component regulator propeller domain-containing protein [Acidobacteriota bacterium]